MCQGTSGQEEGSPPWPGMLTLVIGRTSHLGTGKNMVTPRRSPWVPLGTPSSNFDSKSTSTATMAYKGHGDQGLSPLGSGGNQNRCHLRARGTCGGGTPERSLSWSDPRGDCGGSVRHRPGRPPGIKGLLPQLLGVLTADGCAPLTRHSRSGLRVMTKQHWVHMTSPFAWSRERPLLSKDIDLKSTP